MQQQDKARPRSRRYHSGRVMENMLVNKTELNRGRLMHKICQIRSHAVHSGPPDTMLVFVRIY